MAFRIQDDACIACGACQPVCPVACISAKPDEKRVIDESRCIDCGACASACPVACISQI